jgi:hypothetical protein
MNARMQSFWDIHPEVRDLAARLDAQGLNYCDIQAGIRERFGDGLVPSRTQIWSLRKGLVSGRWTVPAEETAVRTIPIGKKVRAIHFWDRNPDVRDAALTMLPFENDFIISELRKRFEILPIDTRKQFTSLRYGVLTGRWQVPERPILPKLAPKTAESDGNGAEMAETPEKATTLLATEWVGCRIRGVTVLSGRACLTRQLSAVKRQTGRTWRIDATHKTLYPGFQACSECPNWLTDEELSITAAIMHGKAPPARGDNGRRIL